jgi:hypothetical protein
MPRRALLVALRFAVVYGALTWLAAVTPVYAELERPTAAIANALLRDGAGESRALSFQTEGMGGSYTYELRSGAQGRRLERPMHAHGFVMLLFIALAAASPWLGARRFAIAASAGALGVLLVCVLMLMGDVAHWDAEAHALLGQSDAASRPYLVPLGFVAGLHQTAAAGILPIAYWAMLAIRPSALRG